MNHYTYEQVFSASKDYFNGEELAAKCFTDKYALKNQEDQYLELTPDDMHKRLAKEFARIELKYVNPISEEEIYGWLKGFCKIIAQGSPMSGIGNKHQIMSLSNCQVIDSPYDSYGGILRTDEELVQLSKRRCGVGFDISTIRPKGISVKNAAKTTDGIGIFMDRFSNSCREVAQHGRRGALIITISINHPEIETFINIKKDLKRVTGANISIRLNDEFMQAVKDDSQYQLKWPVESNNPTITKEIKAKELWDKIIDSSHFSAEPGLLFWSTVKKMTPAECYKDFGFEHISVNPCQPKWAKVLTKNGWTDFGDITIGDEIWSIEGWTKVIKKWSNGIKKVYRYNLENGCVFNGTKNHKIVQNGSKIEVDDAEFIDSFEECERTTNWSPSDRKTKQTKPYRITSREYVSTEEVFDITVDNKTHTYWTGGVNVSNCAELILSAYDSCRLLVINLSGFVNNPFAPQAFFDYDKFKNAAVVGQRLLDDMIDLEVECIDKILDKINKDKEPENIRRVELELWNKIKKNCLNGRRTGLGITALGDVLAGLNVIYGSNDSLEIVNKIYKTLALGSYRSSVDLAKQRGTFPIYNHKLEKNHPFLNNIWKEDGELYNDYLKYGRRNISNLTTAPTGTVSIVSNLFGSKYFNTTSGIEPAFLLSYTRRKKVVSDDKNAKVDFIDASGDKWQEFEIYHSGFNLWKDIIGKNNIKECPYFGGTSADIDWKRSVEIQSIAQKWVCHSISKTCNVPNNTSKQLIGEIYLKAWESGCKGFTVYRDGCRTGVLVDNKESGKSLNKEIRPKSIKGELHHLIVNGLQYYVAAGFNSNNELFEIFTGINENKKDKISKSIKSGNIIRYGHGKYSFLPDNNDDMEFSLCNGHNNKDADAVCRLISMSLQNNISIDKIIDQLHKTDSSIGSFIRALCRTLSKYSKNNHFNEKCPECGDSMIKIEGCSKCKCGFSKCG